MVQAVTASISFWSEMPSSGPSNRFNLFRKACFSRHEFRARAREHGDECLQRNKVIARERLARGEAPLHLVGKAELRADPVALGRQPHRAPRLPRAPGQERRSRADHPDRARLPLGLPHRAAKERGAHSRAKGGPRRPRGGPTGTHQGFKRGGMITRAQQQLRIEPERFCVVRICTENVAHDGGGAFSVTRCELVTACSSSAPMSRSSSAIARSYRGPAWQVPAVGRCPAGRARRPS